MNEPIAVRESQVEPADVGGLLRTLFHEEVPSGEVAFGTLELGPGLRVPQEGTSRHDGVLELCYVMSGTVRIETAGKEFTLRAGDAFLNPPGSEHFTENPGTEPARVVWALAPST